MQISWRKQTQWIETSAAIAFDHVAAQLANRLLNKPAQELEQLQLSGSSNILFVLGEVKFLPWCDGLIYLTNMFDANIFHPCSYIPNIPLDWIAEAIFTKTNSKQAVLLNNSDVLLPINNLQIGNIDVIQHWLTNYSDHHAVT